MPAPKGNQHAAKGEADKASSFLHLRVRRQDKAAWVRAAQSRGLGLSAWVVEQLTKGSK